MPKVLDGHNAMTNSLQQQIAHPILNKFTLTTESTPYAMPLKPYNMSATEQYGLAYKHAEEIDAHLNSYLITYPPNKHPYYWAILLRTIRYSLNVIEPTIGRTKETKVTL